jgi:hypothetical protein
LKQKLLAGRSEWAQDDRPATSGARKVEHRSNLRISFNSTFGLSISACYQFRFSSFQFRSSRFDFRFSSFDFGACGVYIILLQDAQMEILRDIPARFFGEPRTPRRIALSGASRCACQSDAQRENKERL